MEMESHIEAIHRQLVDHEDLNESHKKCFGLESLNPPLMERSSEVCLL